MPIAPDASRPRLARVLVGGLLLTAAYVVAARFGLRLASIHGSVSPVWPATGVAIGGLVLGGVRLWPAVMVGAFVANLSGPLPAWGAALVAAGNTGEAVLGAWIIARLRAHRTSLVLLWEAAACGSAALVAPLCSAAVGIATLAATGTGGERGLPALLWTWWLGDAIGTLAVVPLMLAIGRRAWRTTFTDLRWMVAVAGAVATAGAVFFTPPGESFLFVLFPALLVVTRIGGELGAKAGAIGISAVGIAAAILSHGPFVGGSLNDNLLFLQFFLGSVAVAALVLPVFAAAGALGTAGLFLIVGWMVSGWAFAHLHRERLDTDAQRLAGLAADTERTTRQRLATYLEALRAGEGLFGASKEVDREEWQRFVAALRLDERLPGIHALGVARRVLAREEADFVNRRRADGESNYTVSLVPDGTGPLPGERFLIAFAEPAERNRDRPGLDLASEARRRQAAEEARDAGEPRASSRIQMLMNTGTRAGFLVFHPIYGRGPLPATVAERRAAHVGWVFAAFVAEEFFKNVFVSPELEMTVFDGRSISAEAMLFSSHQGAPAGFERTAVIELAGNLVTLAWNRSATFEVASPVASVLTATSLALVTLLLAGLGVSLQSIGRHAREIATTRTAELSAAQATLAGINRLHRAVLDGTTYSIIATETDGTIRIFNRGAETMLGYRREELIGRQTPAIFHLPEEVVARATELSAELGRRLEPGFEVFVARAARGEVEQREWTYVRRNGTRVPVLLSVTALRDDAGTITGYLGIAHDLTERRALEQSLRIEQSRLRLANEAAGIAVWEWDVATGTLTWDAAMFALYGMAPTVGGRVSYDDWRHCVHPDDLLAQEAALQRTVREAGRSQREFRIIRYGDDEIRYLSASDLAILGPDGRAVRVVGVNRDITDRRRVLEQVRQSQARLSTIFGAVREGLMLLDAGGRVLECNAAACRLLGATREQLEGELSAPEAWRAVRVDGRVYPADEFPVSVTRRTAAPVRDVVMGLPRPDGSLVWVSIDTAVIHDPAGGVQAVVVSLNDVSAQQQIASDLARARDEAVETSRLKSEFLATMSHEIRTPMNGIIGTVDLLLGTPLDPTQNEMAQLIQGSAENLLEIINDILDFSRIEAGKFRLNPEPFEPLPLLEDSVSLLAGRAQRKGLEFVLDADPALAADVLEGDPGRIRQVLLNIIGNAVKFTDRGEVVVAASVMPTGTGTGRLRVAVRDTGIGIASEFRDRLFSAFTQVDSSATRRFGGTGLGLAISRQLMELMGGRLDFTSEPGRGSEFWIELDLPRTPGEPVGGEDADLDVLVVDDNAAARAALLRQLRALGVRASAAEGAAAALDVLAAPRARAGRRVILVDRAMPGTDGLVFARRVRETFSADEVALVLLNPAGAAPAPHELDGLGCAAVLAKPVRLAQLRVALSQARHVPAGTEVQSRGATLRPGPEAAAAGGLDILVAEDNPTNQLVARMVLESLGHRVDMADNGRIALERLAEAHYDVVFMDCQMPELDGYEATRRVRSGVIAGIDPKQRVIALTAFAMESDRAKCREAGMDDYVSKPMRAAEVRAVLERCGLTGAGRTDAGAGDPPPAHDPAPLLAGAGAEPLVDEPFLEGLRDLPGLHGPSLLAEVVALYTRETATRLDEMPALLDSGRLDDLARAAHTLAGSSANAGAPRARAAFAAVEQAVRAGALAEVPARVATARAVWQELSAEFVRRGLLSP
ncbi:MAG: CHASE domain-containing protein [Opitutaceae bacterium]|nr:CHASE domain-containing protein [Opitutaceae bacterium]